MFVFRKIWRALFAWNTSFEIRLFALLPAIYMLKNISKIMKWAVHSRTKLIVFFPLVIVTLIVP